MELWINRAKRVREGEVVRYKGEEKEKRGREM